MDGVEGEYGYKTLFIKRLERITPRINEINNLKNWKK